MDFLGPRSLLLPMRYHVAPRVQNEMEELFKSLLAVRNLSVLQAVYDILLTDLYSAYSELCPNVKLNAPDGLQIDTTDRVAASAVAKALFVFKALSCIGKWHPVLRYSRNELGDWRSVVIFPFSHQQPRSIPFWACGG